MRLSSIRVVPCVFVVLIPLSVAAFSPAFAGQYGSFYTYPAQQVVPSYPNYRGEQRRAQHAGARIPRSQSRPLIVYNVPPSPYSRHGHVNRHQFYGRQQYQNLPNSNTTIAAGLIAPLSVWSAPTITQIGLPVATTTVQNYTVYSEPPPVIYQTAARCNNPHIIEFSSPPAREEVRTGPDVIYLNSTPCQGAKIDYVGKVHY